ncbi:MAG: hypothetical protein HZA37_02700 [Parcubacteria group bacterium]|nr:hypothetical protein [Parcubacteria group bacterium]
MMNNAEKPNIRPDARKRAATPEEIAAYRGIIVNTEKHFRESSEEEREKMPDFLSYLNAVSLTDGDLEAGVMLEKWRAENGMLVGEKSREFLDFFHAREHRAEEDLRREIKESLKKELPKEEVDEDFLEALIVQRLEENPRYNFYLYLNRKIEEKIKNGEK